MQPSEIEFDELLRKGLRNHNENISDDFANKLLAKIKVLEQQRILKKIIIQKRISIAGLILLPLIFISIIAAYPNLLTVSGKLQTAIYSLIYNAIGAAFKQWQLIIFYASIFSACLLAVYQTLVADN